MTANVLFSQHLFRTSKMAMRLFDVVTISIWARNKGHQMTIKPDFFENGHAFFCRIQDGRPVRYFIKRTDWEKPNLQTIFRKELVHMKKPSSFDGFPTDADLVTSPYYNGKADQPAADSKAAELCSVMAAQ
jgi:hypothetical protein